MAQGGHKRRGKRRKVRKADEGVRSSGSHRIFVKDGFSSEQDTEPKDLDKRVTW